MLKSEYQELLQREEWKIRRKQILKRDKYKCCKCDSKENLHVHHIWYIEGNMPWEAPNEHLQTLCETCHTKEHAKKPIYICSYLEQKLK